MAEKPPQYTYENGSIKVSFDGNKCAHAGYCFRELHDVFDGDRDPPIDLTGGSVEDIVRTIEKCPSSALTYERLDNGQNEVTPASVTATMVENGPLALRGEIQIGDEKLSRVTLCRCGKSNSKPFCDGSHHHHQFDDHAEVAVEEGLQTIETSSITLTPFPNGPVGFQGSVTVKSASGETLCQRDKGAFCRCGASKKKPFCDGTHNGIEFKT